MKVQKCIPISTYLVHEMHGKLTCFKTFVDDVVGATGIDEKFSGCEEDQGCKYLVSFSFCFALVSWNIW